MAIGELIRNNDLLWDGVQDHDIVFTPVDAAGAPTAAGYDPYNSGANFASGNWYPLAPISGDTLSIEPEKEERDRLNADNQKFDRRTVTTSVMISGEIHYDLEKFFRKNRNTTFGVLLKASKRRDGKVKFMYFPVCKFHHDNENTPSSDVFNFEIVAEPVKADYDFGLAASASLTTQAWGESGAQVAAATIIPTNASGVVYVYCTVDAGDYYEEFLLAEDYAGEPAP